MTPQFQRAFFPGGYARLLARHQARRGYLAWWFTALGSRARAWLKGAK